MKTLALNTQLNNQSQPTTVPVTPQGRALYTVDGFLNGKPVLSNHDNPRMTLANVVRTFN